MTLRMLSLCNVFKLNQFLHILMQALSKGKWMMSTGINGPFKALQTDLSTSTALWKKVAPEKQKSVKSDNMDTKWAVSSYLLYQKITSVVKSMRLVP